MRVRPLDQCKRREKAKLRIRVRVRVHIRVPCPLPLRWREGAGDDADMSSTSRLDGREPGCQQCETNDGKQHTETASKQTPRSMPTQPARTSCLQHVETVAARSGQLHTPRSPLSTKVTPPQPGTTARASPDTIIEGSRPWHTWRRPRLLDCPAFTRPPARYRHQARLAWPAWPQLARLTLDGVSRQLR